MPGKKKLEPSLYNCKAHLTLQFAEYLAKQGLSPEIGGEMWLIFKEIEGWLAMAEHPIPDYEGWYRIFADFVLIGDPGETCPSRIIYPKGKFNPKPNQVDLDHPETWEQSPTPQK